MRQSDLRASQISFISDFDSFHPADHLGYFMRMNYIESSLTIAKELPWSFPSTIEGGDASEE
jgi:hypothetical protein